MDKPYRRLLSTYSPLYKYKGVKTVGCNCTLLSTCKFNVVCLWSGINPVSLCANITYALSLGCEYTCIMKVPLYLNEWVLLEKRTISTYFLFRVFHLENSKKNQFTNFINIDHFAKIKQITKKWWPCNNS